jgi:hypothetical protein
MYTFPPDTDKWTGMILEEAHHIYTLLAKEKIQTTISVHDYQDYWQRANGRISSSFGRLHFGHYTAASYSTSLSSLRAAKHTACGRMGISLARWSIGLTFSWRRPEAITLLI